ncbi:MAG: transposase family protein [Candidatus Thiodiazotropha sp.]
MKLAEVFFSHKFHIEMTTCMGSSICSFQGFHSIVLLALVDADYKILWVDVGANGASSDAQVFNSSDLKEAIEDGSIGFPDADNLPGDDRPMPYFIIGDDAFSLRTWLMKPYSKRNLTDGERIFNYRQVDAL